MKSLLSSDFQYYKNDLLKQFKDHLDIISNERTAIEKEDESVLEAKEKWGIEFLLLRLLQNTQLSDNPRSMSNLSVEVVKYNKIKSKNPINIKYIIEQGWVREIWGQWFLPHNIVFNLPRFKTQSHELLSFLEKLKLIPYPDTRVFSIDKLEEIVKQHCSIYNDFPGISWLYEEKIIIEHENLDILNVQSEFIENSAKYLLAKLWEENFVGPNNKEDRLSWLMERFELFYSGGNFVEMLNPKAREEFLDVCYERLLKEEDLMGWASEKSKIAIERTIDIEEIPQDISMPSNKLIDQLQWCDQYHLEDYLFVNRSRVSLQILFNFIIKFEHTFFESDRKRFINLLDSALERPSFMQFLLEATKDQQHNTIPFLLTQKKYISIGLYLLSNVVNKGELNRDKLLRSNEYKLLWEDGLLFAFDTLSTCSDEEIADLLIEIANFLSEKVAKVSFDSNLATEKINKQNWHAFLNRVEELIKTKELSKTDYTYVTLNNKLSEKMEREEYPFQHHLWSFYQWVLNKLITNKSNYDTVGKQCSQFLKQYKASLLSLPEAEGYIKFKPTENPKSWISIVSLCQKEDSVTVKRFIECGERLIEQMETADLNNKIKLKLNCNLLLKNHVNLLADLINCWPEEEQIPNIICTQFKEMILYGIRDNAEEFKTESIFKLGPIYSQKHIEQYLTFLRGTSKALMILSNEDKEQVISQVKSSHGLLFATVLYNHMTNEEDKTKLRENILPALYKVIQEQAFIIPELFVITNELLTSEEKEFVNVVVEFLKQYEPKIKSRFEWQDWLMNIRFQLAYYFKDRDFISIENIPKEYKNEAYTKLKFSFYEGLVKLDKEDGSIKEAYTHFTYLRKQEPDNVAIAVNQVAAYVRMTEYIIKKENPDNEARKKLAEEAEVLFHEIEKGFYPFESSTSYEIYVSNRLYFYLLIEKNILFWKCYYNLPEDIKYTLKIGTYALQLFTHEEQWFSASTLLKQLKELYGNLPLFEQLEKELEEKEENKQVNLMPPDFMENLYDVKVIGQAVTNLTHLQIGDQVKAVRGDVFWKQYLLEQVIHVSNKVQEYSPNLKTGDSLAGEEDRYTDLFKYLYDENMRMLGWTVSTQARGGVTSKETDTGRGGVGERDLTFYNNNRANLALGEAVVLKGASSGVISDHVKKAFSYDIPPTNYCIIINWGYTDNVERVWDSYKDIIRNKCDFGEYEILEIGTLKELYPSLSYVPDYQFYTKHKTEHKSEEAYMIHLYVDVKHQEKVSLRD